MQVSNSAQLVCLEASAGSGKTYALALRYVYLLFEGARVEEILTLTFTTKAVREMQERIAKFLEILGGEGEGREELIESLQKNYAISLEQINKNAKRLLRLFYTSSPKIMTIDAFFYSIAKRFCWYMGLPYHFLLQPLNLQEIHERFLSTLGERQKDHLLQICFNHARTLQDTLALINAVNLYYPQSFKEKFLGNLENLKAEILSQAHSIVQIILEHPKSSETAKMRAQFRGFEDLMNKTWIYKAEQFHNFKALKLSPELFAPLKEKLKEYFLLKESIFLGLIEGLSKQYATSKEELIKSHYALDFSDITQKCYDLLARLSSDFFYFRLDEKISHILLDEFQDTSIMQYKILSPLLHEISSGKGRIGERSLFVVGDQKQSIYGFRGGEGRLMQDVQAHFHLKAEKLHSNYRSGANILEFINTLFGECMPHYTPQTPTKAGGYVKIFPTLLFEQDADNKSRVFAQIQSTLEILLAKGAQLSEIAILCFCNQDVLEVGDFLKKHYSSIITEESITLEKKKDAQILLHALKYALSFPLVSPQIQYNLNKLLGERIDAPISVIKWRGQSLGEFIYESIKLYGLYSLEAQKVLELACESEDIEDFLLSVQNSKGGEEEQHGLRILTIHKSKGLEFPHLIVLDRLSKGSYGRDQLFCDYDANLKGSLFLKEAHREEVDALYAHAYNAYKQKQLQERQNILYVALTRALKSLWIMPFNPIRASSEFTSIALLDEKGELLTPSEYGTLEISPLPSPPKIEKTPIQQTDFGRQKDFLKITSPTYTPNHLPSIKKGNALHKALELYLGYQCSFSDLKAFLQNRFGFYLSLAEIEQTIEAVGKISQLFNQKFQFHELKTEISFMLEDKLYRIDCLLLQKTEEEVQKAIVIDYKSGGENKIYEEQIKLYAEFVKIQYPNANVEGYLLYQQEFRLQQVLI